MPDGCIQNCLACGKCGSFNILGAFQGSAQTFRPRPGYGVAVDLGTTTVVLAQADLTTGEIIARHSFFNPQRSFGPDVISRIQAANEGRLSELSRLINESIAAGIKALNIPVEEIVVAGNTTMIHLLLGLSCESLGTAPFKPAHRLEERYRLFGCNTRIIPWFSAFAGGDVMSGVLHVLAYGRERFLLIDLGTNGEMALYDNGKLTVTATAAGPAFEGGHGTASNSIRELARLARTGGSFLPPSVISDLMLAKSAVRSGLEILLEGCVPDVVFLAGGIGQAMDVEDAADSGIIPPGLRGRTHAVGNASLGGAVRLLFSPSEPLPAEFTEINLAGHPRFNQLFMENMAF
jgi:uncharacterized 2Fe-2S/4Fe-4S cluster protein (DUF4445 family)